MSDIDSHDNGNGSATATASVPAEDIEHLDGEPEARLEFGKPVRRRMPPMRPDPTIPIFIGRLPVLHRDSSQRDVSSML